MNVGAGGMKSTLRLTRLHFLTNVDENIYAGFMNIVTFY